MIVVVMWINIYMTHTFEFTRKKDLLVNIE